MGHNFSTSSLYPNLPPQCSSSQSLPSPSPASPLPPPSSVPTTPAPATTMLTSSTTPLPLSTSRHLSTARALRCTTPVPSSPRASLTGSELASPRSLPRRLPTSPSSPLPSPELAPPPSRSAPTTSASRAPRPSSLPLRSSRVSESPPTSVLPLPSATRPTSPLLAPSSSSRLSTRPGSGLLPTPRTRSPSRSLPRSTSTRSSPSPPRSSSPARRTRQPFPSVTVNTKGPYKCKETISVEVPKSSGTVYAAFVDATNTQFQDITKSGGKVTIPEGIAGQSYLILTSGPSVKDSATIAGPAIIFVESD